MRDILFKILNNSGVNSISRYLKNDRITVLSLHRVSEEKDFFFNPISPHEFVEILEYCTKYYSIISFSEIKKTTSKQKLILSFDDGYYDFYEIALPILKRYGLPCNHNFVNECLNNNHVIWTQKLNYVFEYLMTKSIYNDEKIKQYGVDFKNNWWEYYLNFFYKLLNIEFLERENIIDSLINKYNLNCNIRMINWDELINISKHYDVDIGSHTYIHDSMISIKNSDLFNYHITQSVEEINQRLGIDIDILSLPNGQLNTKLIEYSKKSGIKYLLHVNNSLNHHDNINLEFNQINRIPIYSESIYETVSRIELTHNFFSKLYGRI